MTCIDDIVVIKNDCLVTIALGKFMAHCKRKELLSKRKREEKEYKDPFKCSMKIAHYKTGAEEKTVNLNQTFFPVEKRCIVK